MTVVGAGGPIELWYLARSAGVVSLLLLTASVALGIVTTIRWSSDRWPRFAISFLHRNVSLVALALLALHITIVVVDGFAPIGWKDAFIPFASPYRPVWLGLGTLAFDLVLVLTVTSLARNRIGPRTWRVIHWFSYVCWPIAVLHGFGTGTDAGTTVVLLITGACVALVVGCVCWRAAVGWSRDGAVWGSAVAASLVAPVALVVWLGSGPLATGWARRAGTPEALLHDHNAVVATFRGTIQRSDDPIGDVVLDITTSLHDGTTGTLIMQLHGLNRAEGTFALQEGTVSIHSTTGQDLFDGDANPRGDDIVTSATSASPSPGTFTIQFDVFDAHGGRAVGTVRQQSGG